MNGSNWKLTCGATALAFCTVISHAETKLTPISGSPARNERPALVDDGGEPAGLGAAPADPQVQDDLLAGLDQLGKNAKERNEVNLDKNMMGLAAGHRGGRYADLSQKMDFIVVRNYEFAGKDQYRKSDLDALRHRLEGTGWSHLVRNEGEGEMNDIVVKAGPDGFISDMVILNAEPKELNIVHLRGHFHMEDVNNAMGSAMSVSGSTFGVTNAMTHGLSHSESHSDTHSETHSETHTTPPAPPAAPAAPRQ